VTPDGTWEKQSAASLRVASFQSPVISESDELATDHRDFALCMDKRHAEAEKRSAIFSQLVTLFMVRAHRDPTRLSACFQNRREWGEVVPVGWRRTARRIYVPVH